MDVINIRTQHTIIFLTDLLHPKLVRGMAMENDATGTTERTKKFWYYLVDIHLRIIFMPDSSLDVVA